MRRFLGLVALLSSLALVAPLTAQGPGTFSVNPRPIRLGSVNTQQMNSAVNLKNVFHTPQQQQSFNLGNIFRSIPMPTWPPRIASTPLLQPGNNKFQPQQNSKLNIFPTTATYPTTNNPYIIHKAWN